MSKETCRVIARVGILNKTLKWKKEKFSKISVFENQNGKGYGN